MFKRKEQELDIHKDCFKKETITLENINSELPMLIITNGKREFLEYDHKFKQIGTFTFIPELRDYSQQDLFKLAQKLEEFIKNENII